MKHIVVMYSVIAVVIIIAGIVIHANNSKEVTSNMIISIEPVYHEDTESYFEKVSINDMDYYKYFEIEDFVTQCNSTIQEDAKNFHTPYHIETNVSMTETQTIVVMSGEYRNSSNERMDYRKELVFDFLLTPNILEESMPELPESVS